MGNIPKYASCICNKQQDKGEMDLNKDKEELLKKFEEKKNHSFDFHQHEYPNQTSFLDFNNSNTNNYDNEIVNYIYLKEKMTYLDHSPANLSLATANKYLFFLGQPIVRDK